LNLVTPNAVTAGDASTALVKPATAGFGPSQVDGASQHDGVGVDRGALHPQAHPRGTEIVGEVRDAPVHELVELRVGDREDTRGRRLDLVDDPAFEETEDDVQERVGLGDGQARPADQRHHQIAAARREPEVLPQPEVERAAGRAAEPRSSRAASPPTARSSRCRSGAAGVHVPFGDR
jgi:hypothetical protein